CYDVCGVPGVRVRIGYRKREPDLAHERYIRSVVTDACAGGSLDLEAHAQALKSNDLVRLPLEQEPHAQLATAGSHHRRGAAGDDSDVDTCAADLLDPEPVAHVKDLQGLSSRAEMQASVGHHAVDVEYEKANRGGGVTRRAQGRHVASGSHDAGAKQVVNVECADQPSMLIRNRQRRDAMELHQMHGLGREIPWTDRLAVARHDGADGGLADIDRLVERAAK